MSAGSERNGNGPLAINAGVTTRTTASDERACKRCGGEIRGRRWNGFCSDRCRMADRRERINERRRGMLSRLKGVVGEIEADWFPPASKEQP